MIFVATKKGRTKKTFLLLFWYCCWIRDPRSGTDKNPSVADPGPFLTPASGIRGLFDPWIGDPGWVKSQDPDPG
jgi:hypothetical protein